MNKMIFSGRMTKDPEVRYTTGDNPTAIARFTVAADRKKKVEGKPSADFIDCVAYAGQAEFLEKYGAKGKKFAFVGRYTTDSYTNKDGKKVYTTCATIEEIEFDEPKSGSNSSSTDTSFMDIPDIPEEQMPFN